VLAAPSGKGCCAFHVGGELCIISVQIPGWAGRLSPRPYLTRGRCHHPYLGVPTPEESAQFVEQMGDSPQPRRVIHRLWRVIHNGASSWPNLRALLGPRRGGCRREEAALQEPCRRTLPGTSVPSGDAAAGLEAGRPRHRLIHPARWRPRILPTESRSHRENDPVLGSSPQKLRRPIPSPRRRTARD